ncbi:hypothetical protein KJ564_12980, partial [bacterium]|nr:hypothetical protein [bacterium]
MRNLTAIVILLVLALPAFAQVDYTKTTVTRWAGPGEPGSYADYRAEHPYTPATWREVDRRFSSVDQTGPVLIVMQTNLQGPLTGYIDTYLTDLTNEGWDPILIHFSGSEPADLKAVITDYYYSDDILGALLIGDLPVAWFELYEDFDNDGLPDNPYQVQFPCDLYYMDLDGGWYDGDVDGVLDTHVFNWEPEIFVGQLIASPLGNEIALLQNYFDKNHNFRTGAITLPGIGLAYIDDDWSGSGSQWGGALAMATGIANMIYEPDSTTAADYLDRLDDGYYAILLCAHSSPQLHQISEQGGTVYNNVYNYQIQEADPDAFFYNLFNCSGARYTENGYIGGWYVFGDTYGVSGLGSTKTGSMLYFEDFYGVIEEGECVGEAFRQWFALHGQEPGSVMWAMSWFYGMTHLGDPTLFMKVGVEITDVQVIDDGSQGSSGDGDGIPDAGETVALNLTLQNNDAQPYADLSVKLIALSSHLTWLEDSVFVGTLPASGTIQAAGFLLQIDEDAPDNTEISVSAQITNPSSLWGDNFDLILRAPYLELLSYEMVEISGNGDTFADPGESFFLLLTLKNGGGDEADNATVNIQPVTDQLYVLCSHGVDPLPSINPGEIYTTSQPTGIGVEIDITSPGNYVAELKANIEIGTQWDFTPRFLFQVGNQLNWLHEVPAEDSILVSYAISESYFDQWHVEDYRSYSADYSWKFG